jgi:hypothetical protein
LSTAKALEKSHLPALKKLFLGSSSIATFQFASAICEISGADPDVSSKMDDILSNGPPEQVQLAVKIFERCDALSDDRVRKIAGWIKDAEPVGPGSGLLTELATFGPKARIISAKLIDLLPVTRASDGLSEVFARADGRYLHKLPMAALIASGPHDEDTLARIMIDAHAGGFSTSDLTAFAYELSGAKKENLDFIGLLRDAESPNVGTTDDLTPISHPAITRVRS